MKHIVSKYSCDICNSWTEPEYLIPVVIHPIHTDFYSVGDSVIETADKHVCTNCVYELQKRLKETGHE